MAKEREEWPIHFRFIRHRKSRSLERLTNSRAKRNLIYKRSQRLAELSVLLSPAIFPPMYRMPQRPYSKQYLNRAIHMSPAGSGGERHIEPNPTYIWQFQQPPLDTHTTSVNLIHQSVCTQARLSPLPSLPLSSTGV